MLRSYCLNSFINLEVLSIVVYDIAPMRQQKVGYHLTLVLRGVFSVFAFFVGIFSVLIDTVTNEVINIMFVGPTRATGDLRGFFRKF